jgi:signal transduction histidine kinase
LTAVVRDEAYRIAREAVSNAYQHAKSGNVETEVIFGDADLTIRVRDDGIGVDPQILARGQRPGHWGLPGMRERSESFGGHLRVWSEGNAGTELELRIPALLAVVVQGYMIRLRPNKRASTDQAPGPNIARDKLTAAQTTNDNSNRRPRAITMT